MSRNLHMPAPHPPAQRLRVNRDVAAMVRRIQALPGGEYAMVFTVGYDGRLTWRLAGLGDGESVDTSSNI